MEKQQFCIDESKPSHWLEVQGDLATQIEWRNDGAFQYPPLPQCALEPGLELQTICLPPENASCVTRHFRGFPSTLIFSHSHGVNDHS
ncbi:hypothetical protein TNCV_3083011 [Trichonephila clavipes]|nr:hypothetical protein TNCV_3083011 [Trichonephila clavipes]